MKKQVIDLNADVGEGFGPYRMGNDDALFEHITSASIACGFHAGDATTMRKTLQSAAEREIAVGAHPGYPDRLHFGRVVLPYPVDELIDLILYQVGALQTLAESAGLTLQHIKLHGALYHVAASDRKLSEALLDAIVRLDNPLVVVGPPNSILQQEAEDRGLDYAPEGFVDRGYGEEGKLIHRGRPHSLLSDPTAAAEQAVELARDHRVKTASGKKIDMKVMTLCVHGDTPHAPEIAARVRNALEAARISVVPLRKMFE
jgi:UPF0271 protein